MLAPGRAGPPESIDRGMTRRRKPYRTRSWSLRRRVKIGVRATGSIKQ